MIPFPDQIEWLGALIDGLSQFIKCATPATLDYCLSVFVDPFAEELTVWHLTVEESRQLSLAWKRLLDESSKRRPSMAKVELLARRMLKAANNLKDRLSLKRPTREHKEHVQEQPTKMTVQDLRNQWFYEQCFDVNQTLDQIAANMPRDRKWRRVAGKQGVRFAVAQHVKKFNLAPPPPRQNK